MIKRLTGEQTDIQTEATLQNSDTSCSNGFSKLEAKMNLLIQLTPPTDQTTKQKLENVCNGARLPFDKNVLEYWKSTYISNPELAKLLDVTLSVPSTQVSVERAFSALSTILTKLRCKLSKDTINNILLVKLNKNLIKHATSTVETSDN